MMMRSARYLILLMLVAGCTDASSIPSVPVRNDADVDADAAVAVAPSPQDDRPFETRRAEFATKLIATGPSPQPYEVEMPPAGVREIEYPSGDLRLKAWLYVPQEDVSKRYTALVYLHGGFAFGSSDLYDCLPFIKAGYVVMTPMLRGENGLPGNFECYWGELDDAAAAVNWLHSQPFVNPDKLYVFGHSSGGQLSALLSLVDGVPMQHSGSSGGLYDTTVFDAMPAERVPFDKSNLIERELRVLPGNLRWMHRKHHAFVGREDPYVLHGAKTAQQDPGVTQGKLFVNLLAGDHGSSLPQAMAEYIQVIEHGK